LVPESQRFEEVPNREEDATEEHSFDELARGLASGAISRRKALKLGGVALLGGFGLFSVFPDAAEARRRRGRRRGRGLGQRSSRTCGINESGCNFGSCVCPRNTFCITNNNNNFNDPGFCSSSSSSRTCGINESGCNFGSCVCPRNTFCRTNNNNNFNDPGFCS
jgi:hypothetical protein